MLISSVRQNHPDGITVFNFEVEGDHTYFVEDGIGETTAVWVHNTCRDPIDAFNITIRRPNAARADLREAMIEAYGIAALSGKESHHVIPIGAIRDYDVIRVIMKASKAGFHINDVGNGYILPSNHGPHSAYTNDVIAAIRARIGDVTSDANAREVIESVVNRAKTEFIPNYWPEN